MTWLKYAVGVGMVALFTAGVANNAISQTNDDSKLGAAEIAKKSLAAYAALTSYSDEGKTVSSVGTNNLEHTFSIKLSRPNLYRISWSQIGAPMGTGSVWSAGEGDFMKAKDGAPTKESTMEQALGQAMYLSGGAAGTVPGTFFDLNLGNLLKFMGKAGTRKSDEKLDGVDCYVVTVETNGIAQTLWIGKNDFLIRQKQSNASEAALNAMLDNNSVLNSGIRMKVGDVKTVETHLNIRINPSLTKKDFAP